MELLIRYLKALNVRRLRLAGLNPGKRTIERVDVEQIAVEFHAFLRNALPAGENELPIVEEAQHALPLMLDWAVELVAADAEQARRAFAWTRRLNRAAPYDGFYLALAESMQCDLWTADQRLQNAVNLPWVRLA